MPNYIVRTDEYGDIIKTDDNIADARKWAKRALGIAPSRVTRQYTPRRCPDCLCTPCCCMLRKDV